MLYAIVGVANACGIDEAEERSFQHKGVLNRVVGCALNVRYDGFVVLKELVEKGGFSYVWRTDYGNGNTVLNGISGGKRIREP